MFAWLFYLEMNLLMALRIATVKKKPAELLVELQNYDSARSRLSCQVDFTEALDGLPLTIAPDE